MFGGLNRILAAAVVTAAFLVVPSAALADNCGGGPSAQNVYTECLGSGGGGKSTSHSGGGSTGGANTGGPNSGSVSISHQAKVALAKAGQDGRSLAHLVRGFGGAPTLNSSGAGSAAEPTAVGSAFDLGSGPTALLIVLAGTAVVLLGGSGMRVRRNRHRA